MSLPENLWIINKVLLKNEELCLRPSAGTFFCQLPAKKIVGPKSVSQHRLCSVARDWRRGSWNSQICFLFRWGPRGCTVCDRRLEMKGWSRQIWGRKLRGLSKMEGRSQLQKQRERDRTGKDLEQWDGQLGPVTLCNRAVTWRDPTGGTVSQVLLPKLPPVFGGWARAPAPGSSPSAWQTPPLFSAAQVLLPGLQSPPGKQGHSYLFRIGILEELRIVYLRLNHV